MPPKWILFLVVPIILLGGVLRLTSLNSLPIFADESIYIRWSQVMRVEPSLRFLPLSDGKQPLYMWTVIPALKFISDPLLAGRLVSALMGLGTLFGVTMVSYLLFKNPRISLITATIYAVLPYTVFFDRLALADSMLNMFIIWGIFFQILAIKHTRLDWAMISGFCFGFAWLTKSPAQIPLLLLPSLLILMPYLTRQKLFHSLLNMLATCVIAFAMYNILRLGPEFHQIAIRNLDYIFSWSEILKHPIDPLIPHLKDSFQFYCYLATPIGLLFAIWGLFDPRKNHWQERFILGAFFLLPILAQSAIAKSFTARYIFFTVPFAVILIAHAIDHLGERTKRHFLVFIAAALVILPSLSLSITLVSSPTSMPLPRIERSGYLEEWTSGLGIKEVAEVIKTRSTLGPVVVGSEGFFGTPFSALELYLNGIPSVRITGIGVHIDAVDPRLISATEDNQVFMVINSSRLYVDPANFKHPVRLLGAFPKAMRPDGSRDSLLFFEILNP